MNTPDFFRVATERILASQTRVTGRGVFEMDIMVGLLTRLEPTEIVKALTDSYGKAFTRISGYLDRADLLILYEVGGYWIFALADPTFSPADCLGLMLDDHETIDRLERSPIGRTVSLPRVVRELRAILARMDDDTARALWAALAFAKSADLRPEQISGVEWWKPEFIDNWQPNANPT